MVAMEEVMCKGSLVWWPTTTPQHNSNKIFNTDIDDWEVVSIGLGVKWLEAI